MRWLKFKSNIFTILSIFFSNLFPLYYIINTINNILLLYTIISNYYIIIGCNFPILRRLFSIGLSWLGLTSLERRCHFSLLRKVSI